MSRRHTIKEAVVLLEKEGLDVSEHRLRYLVSKERISHWKAPLGTTVYVDVDEVRTAMTPVEHPAKGGEA